MTFQGTRLDLLFEDATELTPVAPILINAVKLLFEKIGFPDSETIVSSLNNNE